MHYIPSILLLIAAAAALTVESTSPIQAIPTIPFKFHSTDQCRVNYDKEVKAGCYSNYKVVKELGHGFFGTVYLATHKTTGDKIALKCKRRGEDKTLIREYCKQLNAAHPNILAVKELVCHDGGPCIAMELAPDGSLESYADKNYHGKFPEDIARPFFKEWAQGLLHMHEIGMANRDVKPENVLLVGKTVKVADLGIACYSTTKGPHKYNCRVNTLMGTPGYKSEEPLLVIQHHPDVRTRDVYALGMSFRQLVTGQAPNGICLRAHTVKDKCMYSSEFVDLIGKMTWPYYKTRITMKQVLEHAWFTGAQLTTDHQEYLDSCERLLKCTQFSYKDDSTQYEPKEKIPEGYSPKAPKFVDYEGEKRTKVVPSGAITSELLIQAGQRLKAASQSESK